MRSLVNGTLDGTGEPVLGGPATLLFWSDRRAATVVEITLYKSGPQKGQPRKVVVQEDDWKVIGGSIDDGSAICAFRKNPNGTKHTFIRKPEGWGGNGGRGCGVTFGRREHYIDPSF